MNPVLILTRNNLELTKRCVDSVRAQDIPTTILFIDNGSTDGTAEWLESQPFPYEEFFASYYEENRGVSFGWNWGLRHFLEDRVEDFDRVLVIGNDTILAPWTYSALLSADQHFVTGVDIGMSPLPDKPDVFPLSPHPDFSCFLIRRECWDKVGPFDERMVSYAGDCDYHIRAHRAGVPLWKAAVPYNHERSSTMNRADAKERCAIQTQANTDRATFNAIYGCLPGTTAYNDIFKEPCGQTQAK